MRRLLRNRHAVTKRRSRPEDAAAAAALAAMGALTCGPERARGRGCAGADGDRGLDAEARAEVRELERP